MSFLPAFEVGQIVTNSEIVNEFQCGNMGGMRRSKKKNALIIISDHTKGLYEDKWFGNILHYTGMGKSGDQDMNFGQNITLEQSNHNGVFVALFEALLPSQYTYRGQVHLVDKPYQEVQIGEDGKPRKVWMFPIKVDTENQQVDNGVLEQSESLRKKKVSKLSNAELKNRAELSQNQCSSNRIVSSKVYVRDEYIAEYAKRRANGKCQLCGNSAPFNDNQGNPYLECHHIVWLSKGGPDSMENTVALCPNCHKKMHVLDLQSDRNLLANLVK